MTGYFPPGMLGFGGASLGNMYAAVNEATAEATLIAGWEGGVRHFDTAPVYGRGLSELRFGHALRRYPRDEFAVSTKVGRRLRPGLEGGGASPTVHEPGAGETALFKSSLPFRVEVDYGYDAAMRSFEESLHRLGMDRVDIVYVHDLGADHLGDAWEDHFTIALSGAFRALRDLRDQKVIKAWGLGNNVIAPCIRAVEQADPDLLQLAGRYSLLDQSAADRLFPLCAARGVRVVVGGPFNSDILAGGSRYDYRPASPEMLARRDRIAAICQVYGIDLRAAALQFCAAHPVVCAVIPGTKHPEKARANARFFTQPIPVSFWQHLKDEGLTY